MTTQKDLKRVVRTRMQKTGESYTAARASVLARSNGKKPLAPPPDYEALAGMKDAVIREKTGKGWAEWTAVLDKVNAHAWLHRDIALHVHNEHDVPQWWTQAVTVGYERIKGLRAIGQRRGGTFEASKSRTFNVPVDQLFDAFANARKRAKWLAGVQLTVRKATQARSIRITWDDGSSVEGWFTAKGDTKSNVSIAHTRLPDRAAVDRQKAFWGERFDALATMLQSSKGRSKPGR